MVNKISLKIIDCDCNKKIHEEFNRIELFPDTQWLIFILHLISTTSGIQYFREENIIPLFEWTQLEFEYDSPLERQRDIEDGFFVPGVPAIIDVDVYYSCMYIITLELLF